MPDLVRHRSCGRGSGQVSPVALAATWTPEHVRGDEEMIARLLILLARGWQLGPSLVLPSSCRYTPSCSAYAITALTRYGAVKGGWLAAKRIARCHPWGGYGPDPVP